MHHFHPYSRSASSEPTTRPWFWQFQPIKTVSTLIHIWNTFQLPTNPHLLTDQAESSLFRRFDPHWCVSSFCCFHLGERTDSEPNTLSQSRQECRNPCDMVSDPPMLAQQVTHTILLSLSVCLSHTRAKTHEHLDTVIWRSSYDSHLVCTPSFSNVNSGQSGEDSEQATNLTTIKQNKRNQIKWMF